jgi:hypothetical protein
MIGGEERVSEFGRLGIYLSRLLDSHGDVVRSFEGRDFTQRLIRLQGSGASLKMRDPHLPFAVSLLCIDYPMQFATSPSDVMSLLRESFEFSEIRDMGVSFRKACDVSHIAGNPIMRGGKRGVRTVGTRFCGDRVFRRLCFPTKKITAAAVKTNIRLGSLCRALAGVRGVDVVAKILLPIIGVPNDVACGAILLALSLEKHFGTFGFEVAQAMVTQVDNAKGLSNALKALGANSSFPGCMLVEGAALQGRATGDVNLADEVRKRTNADEVAKLVISDAETMRPHIRAILDVELPAVSPLPDMDEFWTSRWLWCVNGAQNRASDEALGLEALPGSRRYRRMAAEEVWDNPIPSWDGTTLVSGSPKLECGKTRAIFACDTRSYFAFSYILNTAQREWRGHRVILDPGKNGLSGTARRIRGAQGHGGVNVMLDYDDFNSHHANEVQAAVIDELCQKYDAPAWYRKVLVDSFDKTFIRYGGHDRRSLGTMMSGHRGTSFLNSVLNAAYIRAAIGGPKFDAMVSLHAGDDVYIRSRTLVEASTILEACKRFGCRMNPTKQSIGFNHAEFLRLGIGPNAAVGYLCRSLATLVAGSWASDDPLTPEQGLTSAITSTRSALNRGSFVHLPRIIARCYSSVHGYKRRDLDRLLDGSWALEGSPVYNTDLYIRTYRLQRPEPINRTSLPDNYRDYATRAYLEHHVSPVEVAAMQFCKADPRSTMIGTSYSKGIVPVHSTDKRLARPRLIAQRPYQALGFACVNELVSRPLAGGALASYPLLRLFENRLTDEQIRQLLLMVGGNVSTNNLRASAFGCEGHSCNVIGYLPFGDASSFSKRTSSDNIVVTYHVYS